MGTADYDDGPGLPVLSRTARRADKLLLAANIKARCAEKRWEYPCVSATPTGGIHLSWHVGANRLTITVQQAKSIICVSKTGGANANRELLNVNDAIKRILNVLA